MKAYVFPVPECPASESSWRLEIRDLRLKRGDSERVTNLRPRSANNREALAEAFEKAMWTTLAGLRALSADG